MTELFGSTKQNISLHINNIFKEGELKQISVVKDFLTTALDGKKYRTKEIELLGNLSNNSIFGNQRTNFTYSKGFSIGTANILKDVEKSYDKGKFLLKESKKSDALYS